MGMFCHLVCANVYFYFAKQPKMYSMLLCLVPLNSLEICFQSKHSKMNVALQWNVSIVLEVFLPSCNFTLQGHLFELYPPPLSLQEQ